ncbi:hypothetical protein JCM4914_21870 [Streptomyces platensis subsp. malvinus]
MRIGSSFQKARGFLPFFMLPPVSSPADPSVTPGPPDPPAGSGALPPSGLSRATGPCDRARTPAGDCGRDGSDSARDCVGD